MWYPPLPTDALVSHISTIIRSNSLTHPSVSKSLPPILADSVNFMYIHMFVQCKYIDIYYGSRHSTAGISTEGCMAKSEVQPVRARISSSLLLEVARETAMST
jgi:hypothetical protein